MLEKLASAGVSRGRVEEIVDLYRAVEFNAERRKVPAPTFSEFVTENSREYDIPPGAASLLEEYYILEESATTGEEHPTYTEAKDVLDAIASEVEEDFRGGGGGELECGGPGNDADGGS
ncbi:MAG: hypothetical protein ACTSU5_15395 [Promethearchaeota archaeon]